MQRERGVMGSSIPLLLFFFFANSTLFLFSDAIPSHLRSLPTTSFDEGYTQIFGDSNLMLRRDGKTVHIALDERTGAGFASQDLYLHGFFSASIKLPSDYAAGVVVAFYMSNGDLFENNHDELDFEFLGNIRGREWRVQTNVYGNGSTAVGREERYELWFDPTEDFHQYSIQWAHDRIIFYIDSIPIRNIEREPMGGDFPTKPMSLYATIWDGSGWATSGGRYGVNYKYAPYIAEFADLVLQGCAVDPTDLGSSSSCDGEPDHPTATIPTEQRAAMDRFRRDHMIYSYCDDRDRYPTPPPECGVDKHEAKRVRTGGTRYRDRRNHHGRRHQGRHYRRSPAGREDAAL